MFNRFPYTSITEINLDWIMRKLKEQISGLVASVNGMTGNVVLTASDVGALPDSYTPPAAPVDSVNGQTGTVVLTASDVGSLPDSYSSPVDSVNGQTGTVVLTASDVGAMPDTYTAPVSSVNGQTGAVVITAPVTSVNGQTGAVTIPQAITYDISSQFTATADCTLTRLHAWTLAGMVFVSYVVTIDTSIPSTNVPIFNIPSDYAPTYVDGQSLIDALAYHSDDAIYRMSASGLTNTVYAVTTGLPAGTIRGEIFWRV